MLIVKIFNLSFKAKSLTNIDDNYVYYLLKSNSMFRTKASNANFNYNLITDTNNNYAYYFLKFNNNLKLKLLMQTLTLILL